MDTKKMRARLVVIFALVITLALVLASCAQPAPAPAPAPAPQKIPVTLLGPPVVWGSYAIAIATSDIVGRTTNLDITVRSEKGALAQLQALVDGQGDMAIGGLGSTVDQAYRAYADWEGKEARKELRLYFAYWIIKQSLITTAKTGIKTFPDLKGKRVALYTATSNLNVPPLLEAHGLNPDTDVEYIKMPDIASGEKALALGQIDAMWSDMDADAGKMQLGQAAGLLVALPISKDKHAWLQENYPQIYGPRAFDLFMPGENDLFIVEEPVGVSAAPIYVYGRADVSDEIVYTYVKSWLQNWRLMSKVHAAMAPFTDKMMPVPMSVPYHDAAIKAYKEAELWTDELEQAHQKALEG